MIAFRLIGGPFDGATSQHCWPEPPQAIWIREDPTSGGPLGLRAWPRQRPGAHPYDLAQYDRNVAIYISSDMTDEGWHQVARTSKPTEVVAA